MFYIHQILALKCGVSNEGNRGKCDKCGKYCKMLKINLPMQTPELFYESDIRDTPNIKRIILKHTCTKDNCYMCGVCNKTFVYTKDIV